MTQWLRALAEDLGSVPSIHMAAHNCNLSSMEIWHSFLVFVGIECMCCTYIHVCNTFVTHRNRCINLTLLFKRIFLCVGVLSHVCVYTTWMPAVPTEARKGCWEPWNWNYCELSYRSWELNPGPLEKRWCSSPPSTSPELGVNGIIKAVSYECVVEDCRPAVCIL